MSIDQTRTVDLLPVRPRPTGSRSTRSSAARRATRRRVSRTRRTPASSCRRRSRDGSEDANAATDTHSVSDVAGNTATSAAMHAKVDRKGRRRSPARRRRCWFSAGASPDLVATRHRRGLRPGVADGDRSDQQRGRRRPDDDGRRRRQGRQPHDRRLRVPRRGAERDLPVQGAAQALPSQLPLRAAHPAALPAAGLEGQAGDERRRAAVGRLGEARELVANAKARKTERRSLPPPPARPLLVRAATRAQLPGPGTTRSA